MLRFIGEKIRQLFPERSGDLHLLPPTHSRGEEQSVLHSVSADRVKKYFEIDRSRELILGGTRHIPLGENDEIVYLHEHRGHITDRGPGAYERQLFPDQFEDQDSRSIQSHFEDRWSSSLHMRRSALKKYQWKVLSGGKDRAFQTGKVVLDIGSGEALAIMAFAQEYPQTTFIGVDSGYQEQRDIDVHKPGLQLTKDSWDTLATIPDQSVDTILSLQAVFTWGFLSKKEMTETICAINRIAKRGCILRCDLNLAGYTTVKNDEVVQKMIQFGWKSNHHT